MNNKYTGTIEAREMDMKEYTNASECNPNPKGYYIDNLRAWVPEDVFNKVFTLNTKIEPTADGLKL